MISLFEILQHSRQRQLVVLQGSRSWCDQSLVELSTLDASLQLLSNRELLPSAIPFSKADACLGGETRLVVVDLFDGFNPDVLSIAGGLVQAGGVLMLLSPASDDWDVQADRYARWQDGKHSAQAWFVEYFFRTLLQDTQIGVLLTSESLPGPPASLPPLQPTPIENGQTAEQSVILQRIEQWADEKPGGIALISADRGRGKSTCLGLLVNRLQSSFRILISANARQSAAALLQQAPQAEFVAPDRLLRDCPEAELLIIDEAAMIPLPILRQLVRLYPRLVMATTSGGYEGTGQGFMLRFVIDLEASLTRYHLERPVRWCQDDLLEAWLNRTLMLKPEIATAAPSEISPGDCEIEILSEPGGAQAWPVLQQVYALLNSAHYRTRPSDLRMLMENPDLVLIVARQHGSVLGVALLNLEGGFDPTLCEEIFYGRRRPQGHLLAQMLTAQAGLKGFAGYRGMRVQRIAVATAYRRRGLGTRLIERAMQYGRENSLDYLGASFALDAETSSFWQQLQCRLVHISYASGKSSGSHSIAVLKPIGNKLEREIKQLQQRIQQQLPIWMTQFLRALDAGQVIALLRFADYQATMSELEQHEIEAFTAGNRGFEISFASLQKYVMQRVAQISIEPDSLLIEKAVQNRGWKLLERESGAEGRRQLQQRLRGLVDALRKAC
jgi:tRNA(Met) cytidine acetyltransferase